MPTLIRKLTASLITLALSGALVGCSPAPDAADEPEGSVAQAQQALTSCGGTVVKSGTITDQFGATLGVINLYYSTATLSICGLASFSAAHGSYQICATNNTNVSQPPKCLNYTSSDTNGATPAQILRVGDVGSTTVFVSSPTLGSGSAGFFTRTF